MFTQTLSIFSTGLHIILLGCVGLVVFFVILVILWFTGAFYFACRNFLDGDIPERFQYNKYFIPVGLLFWIGGVLLTYELGRLAVYMEWHV